MLGWRRNIFFSKIILFWMKKKIWYNWLGIEVFFNDWNHIEAHIRERHKAKKKKNFSITSPVFSFIRISIQMWVIFFFFYLLRWFVRNQEKNNLKSFSMLAMLVFFSLINLLLFISFNLNDEYDPMLHNQTHNKIAFIYSNHLYIYFLLLLLILIQFIQNRTTIINIHKI